MSTLTARPSVRRTWWYWLILLLMALPLAAQVTDSPDLTSEGLAGATLRFAVPILLAGLGGLWAERSGTLNIGLDGMMMMGAWSAAWAGLQWGPWAALAAGLLGGMICGLFQALVTLVWGVDQAIAGIVINMAAIGIVRFLSSVTFATMEGGSISQSPRLTQLPLVSMPGAETVLRPIADTGMWWLSDAASIALGVFTDVSLGTILALLLVPVTWWLLTHSRFGLRVRACGENPAAADSLGVSPYRIRTAAQAISGALAGLGGAYLVIAASSLYREGQVAGRGFIGLATVVFGNWNPFGVLGGSMLFGATDALRTRGEESVMALFIVAAVILAVWGVLQWRRGDLRLAIWSGAFGAGALVWFVLGPQIPSELLSVAPYLTTLVVLVLAQQNLRPPAAVGQPYRRTEER